MPPEPLTAEQRTARKAASDADHAETNRIRKEQAEREADEANPFREKVNPNSGFTAEEEKMNRGEMSKTDGRELK